ncbi:unnamed protein product [Rotaria socialis]
MGNSTNKKEKPASSGVPRNYENKKNVLKYSEKRIVQNFTLFWLDEAIDISSTDCQYTLGELRKVVNSVTICTEAQVCQNFIEKVRDEQIFVIVSGTLGHKIVPLVHQYVRLDSIYIFCGEPLKHKEWAQKWPKIKLIESQIERICEALVKEAAQCEQDLTPTSVFPSSNYGNQELNQISRSFMYSQLLKEILLEMNYGEQSIKVLAEFCRESFSKNEEQLRFIGEFEQDYRKYTPIWWYTREGFTYQMLNRSLRTNEIDIIGAMGFFLKDIHHQIKDEYLKRINRKALFIVYRGQGLMNDEFNNMRSNIGGLFSFNSFLSTSVDRNVAMIFAKKRANQPNKIPILFELQVDPTLTTTPFASLNSLSYYQHKEEEILFSMHTIFRIMAVKDGNEGIWEVTLKSVNDSDQQAIELIETTRRNIGETSAVERLGRLMDSIGQCNKAEAFYDLLIETLSKNDEKLLACVYSQLGYIKFKQDKLSEAKSLYDQALLIQKKLGSSAELDLANTYKLLGHWYASDKDSSNALACHERALAIQEKNPDNIGLCQISLGKREDGLENLHKALKIQETLVPVDDLSMVSVCVAIGKAYLEMQDHSPAYKYFEQASHIEEKYPDSNPLKLALIYHNMSTISNELGRYDEAMKCARLAFDLTRKPDISNHPDAILFKNNYEKLRQQQS